MYVKTTRSSFKGLENWDTEPRSLNDLQISVVTDSSDSVLSEYWSQYFPDLYEWLTGKDPFFLRAAPVETVLFMRLG